MESIDVYWHIARRLCADQTFLDEMLSGEQFHHYKGFGLESHAGIVILPGRQLIEQGNTLPAIRTLLQRMKWAIVMITGDEESLVDHTQLQLPNTQLYVMSPVQGKHGPEVRHLINGSQPHLHSSIRKLGEQDRVFDWFFAGQITHIRRVKCVEQLRRMPKGSLLETCGFMQGMPIEEYYRKMLSAKVVPCPSGPVELSCARIFEAIECGCVPVVDGVTPFPEYWNAPKRDYWNWFFGMKELPFPIIYDWAEFPAMLEHLVRDYPFNALRCMKWWDDYKQRFMQTVLSDAASLRNQYGR